MTNIRTFRFIVSILIGFTLILSGDPAAAQSRSPVVVGYLAAFRGLDLSIARTDLAAFTHYNLSFANPDAEGRFVKGGRMTCMEGETGANLRSEEHTSELQSLMRISYAVFCLKNNTIIVNNRP